MTAFTKSRHVSKTVIKSLNIDAKSRVSFEISIHFVYLSILEN